MPGGMKAEAKIDENYFNNDNLYWHGVKAREDKDKLLFTAQQIVDNAPATAHEKVKYFHDEICKRTSYTTADMDIRRAGAYGYLVEGKTKCTGYADAFRLLCELADIPCYVIIGYGNGTPHAWNIVQLEDGEWYEVDCTYGDSNSSYKWFLITSEQMNKDHKRNVSPGEPEIPIANGTLYSFNKKPEKVGNANYKVTDVNTVEYASPAKSVGGTVKIPDTVFINGKNYEVTAIAKNAFKGNKKIKKVVIGSNIKAIGDSAFEKCINLKQVDMSKSKVATLSKSLFKGDKKLSKLTLNGESVLDVQKNALKDISPKCKVIITGKRENHSALVKMLKKQGAKKAKFK